MLAVSILGSSAAFTVEGGGMNTDQDFSIRSMNRAEVDLAIEWAALEGWNPGLHDAECFYAADPGGFLIGHLKDEPVGCISVVAYDASFGFLGLYIVRPQFRGQGLGLKLWQAGMARLGSRNIGLDGVVAQQDNYRKSGFRLDYRNIRYEGLGKPANPSGVVDLSSVSFDRLLAYDSRMFPVTRERFLRCWVRQPQAAGRAVFSNGTLAGYGLIRPCRRGYKIGPLFADDEGIAEDLFQSLAAHAPGAAIYLDVPETNVAAVMLAERHGMQKVFETARMYTGQPPAVPIGSIFGVTTFELG
jgi:ribosomal protein S18 acetylase RimI-like enzyme